MIGERGADLTVGGRWAAHHRADICGVPVSASTSLVSSLIDVAIAKIIVLDTVVSDQERVRWVVLGGRLRLEAHEPIPVLVKPGEALSYLRFGVEAIRNALLEIGSCTTRSAVKRIWPGGQGCSFGF